MSFLRAQMKIFFPQVTIYKPPSSRESSTEAFIVCRNYTPPAGYVPNMDNPLLNLVDSVDFSSYEGVNRAVSPFLACGDLSAYD